jgi:hypothetical protein
MSSCQRQPATKKLECGNLHAADRIEVRAPFDRPVRVLKNREQIDAAVDFIERHREGWTDVWTGPRAPMLMLKFYQGDRYLGGFGLSTSYLVAGFLSQDASSDEIASLARDLGLQWPPQQ